MLADIPGLIEGAHEGKGLGVKFLRHITRTKVLLHCISLEEDDVLGAYDTVRRELSAYSRELADKTEYVVLTKADTRSLSDIQKATALLQSKNAHILNVSILNDALLSAFRKKLLLLLKSV